MPARPAMRVAGYPGIFLQGGVELAQINNMSVPFTGGVINSYNMPQLSRSSVSPRSGRVEATPYLCHPLLSRSKLERYTLSPGLRISNDIISDRKH